MDAIANVILDITFSTQGHTALNIVNPRHTEWNNIMAAISEALMREIKSEAPLPLIPIEEWFSTLEHNAKTLSLEDQKNIVGIFSFSPYSH